MTKDILVTLNPGSSTLKLGLFDISGPRPHRQGKGIIDFRRAPLVLDLAGSEPIPLDAVTEDMRGVTEALFAALAQHVPADAIAGIGHRVVHGGDRFAGPVHITDAALDEIAALVPLAPLHQPQSVHLLRAISRLKPGLPQTASFDTAFHRTQSDLMRRFSIPRALFDEGVKRYGFHGLSYKSIVAQLPGIAPEIAHKRVVVAHLGSGASLCGLDAGESRDTSMSFSTLDGIPMATRTGALDPGVLIHLIKQRGMSIEAVEDLLYHRSGLLGVSDISADCRVLLESKQDSAREAVDLFTLQISRGIAAIANTLGGLDAVVFTAGIGEHQPPIRRAVCDHLAWLGVTIDQAANARNATRIHAPSSAVAVLVVPTDEEQIIAEEALSVLDRG